jgi:hypothetical protein
MSINIQTIYNYVKQHKNYTSHIDKELQKISVINSTTYFPLYKLLFKLNTNNSNSILLNNKYQATTIKKIHNHNSIVIECFDTINPNTKYTKNCFVKYAPLVDPFQYLCGKKVVCDPVMEYKLPVFNDDTDDYKTTIDSPFNPAYVDGFFSYLSSQLKHNYNFKNGIDFYGNFCGIKKNFKVSITDDLSLLNNSTFFMENTNKLFKVDNIEPRYTTPSHNRSFNKKEPLHINDVIELHVDKLNDTPFRAFLHMENDPLNIEAFENLREVVFDENKLEEFQLNVSDDCYTTSVKSNCSSRTSYTTNNNLPDIIDSKSISDINSHSNTQSSYSDVESNNIDGDDEDSDNEDDQDIYAYIDNFPVNVILLEQCNATLGDYIENHEIEEKEMTSILLQLLFTLATYQKCFNFSHNDLHANNIMYSTTNEKYLYYTLGDDTSIYKIPTYGKIWKIIDFGRSVYNISNQVIENMSYSDEGDASRQYNFGIFYSDKFNLRQPNNNFDLCRLGCSLFDYFFDTDDLNNISFDTEMDQLICIDDVNKLNIKNLILKWITDADNHNILYKSNGEERYPGFKLYKMIAIKANERCCPFENIKTPYFQDFIINKDKLSRDIKNKLFVVHKIPTFYA